MILIATTLNSYLGKGMKDICPNGFNATNVNHCAHFVSHAAGFQFGYTCRHQTGKKHAGANLRVHEIFDRCPTKKEIDTDATTESGLIFISGVKNFVTTNDQTTLRNIPRKHIGFLLNGQVWHYSNSQNKVVMQTLKDFKTHYSGQENALWLGTPPAGYTLSLYTKI